MKQWQSLHDGQVDHTQQSLWCLQWPVLLAKDSTSVMPRCPRWFNRFRYVCNSLGKRRKLSHLVPEHLSEFCEVTSIHGLKYVGERRRPLLERLCWAFTFAICLAASCYLIASAWHKWQTTPVIVSLDTTLRSVSTLPFPAITVCPITKVKASVFNYTANLNRYRYNRENFTDEELNDLNVAMLLCYDNFMVHGPNITTDDETIKSILSKISPNRSDIVISLLWNGRFSKPFNVMEPILTDEGMCYSFNMLHKSQLFTDNMFRDVNDTDWHNKTSDWSPDMGFSKMAGLDTYPTRALGSGEGAGVDLYMQMRKENLDYKCTDRSQGFKIHLHNPAEFPLLKQQYFLVPLDQIMFVAVTPHVMTTGEELRGYESSRRQCYFSLERQLRFFSVYTQQNCALECLANYTLLTCGCVAHYMPRAPGTPICGAFYSDCLKYTSEQLIKATAISEVNPGEKDITCDCLQSCNDLTYTSERSQAPHEWKKFFKSARLTEELLDQFIMSRAIIFLKDAHYISTHRSEMYGRTDFLANCGGLLGLCLGVSVLSLVEILYWFFLRLCCSAKWLRREKSRRSTTEGKDIV